MNELCQYTDWIAEYQLRGDCTLKCEEATQEMQEDFPELIRVRGYIIGSLALRQTPHWWLKTESGEIVDPTAKQFGLVVDYEEIDESKPQPTGKCINCGGLCYEGKVACSASCKYELDVLIAGGTL